MQGEFRPPGLVWLLVPVSCHLYGYYWWYTAGSELKDYLEDESLEPLRDVLLSFVTCGLYALFYLPLKFGRLIARAQNKAGLENVRDRGWLFMATMFLGYYAYGWMQAELNRIWETERARELPGPAPALPTSADEDHG